MNGIPTTFQPNPVLIRGRDASSQATFVRLPKTGSAPSSSEDRRNRPARSRRKGPAHLHDFELFRRELNSRVFLGGLIAVGDRSDDVNFPGA